MKKVLLALAVISAGILAIPDMVVSTSQAQVDVNINIGRGGITCAEGRRIVEHRGFRNVRARDCRGNTFRYSGRRGRGRSECTIDVRRRDGRIVGTLPTRCR